ncbi:MAG: secondary thiamine-phosphate synthase enzyme YjbQ [Deltaproteobacteria bacterium]|nr:secondary thiamine-phosphate synthase enzyme YjbQ [Deltaproteobacteria bacterium]
MILKVKTRAKTELIDITSEIHDLIRSSSIKKGFCMLYVPHTTAAVTINESADPSVKSDILMILNKIIPWEAEYRHLEGNSPAHIKSTIVGASELIAIENEKLVLGTWQGIFFCEFDGPRNRKVNVHLYKKNKEEKIHASNE